MSAAISSRRRAALASFADRGSTASNGQRGPGPARAKGTAGVLTLPKKITDTSSSITESNAYVWGIRHELLHVITKPMGNLSNEPDEQVLSNGLK